MTVNPTDVVVIGAGAAGLMAATFACTEGDSGSKQRVVLLEKNSRAGLKILISGGGRCNLTTTRSGKDLERQFGERRGRWLRHALRSFPPTAIIDWFAAAGVLTHEEDLDKIFPNSQKARDVRNALVQAAEAAGVELCYSAAMTGVERTEGGLYRVSSTAGSYFTPRLVIASGGLSFPRTGTTGDGYPIAEQFGHQLTPRVPHLAPLTVQSPWLRELAGIVVDARIEVRDLSGKKLIERHRPILFTHQGLSGPAAMDVAGYIEELDGEVKVSIDLVPEQKREDLDATLSRAGREQGRRQLVQFLPREIPERLRHTLVQLADAVGTQVAELPKKKRRRLVELCKALPIESPRSQGFKAAEVTRGGVALDEVNAKTMESKLSPGLFFAGEVLDIDGPIGGFNFTAAFGTGRLAGLAVSQAR